MQSLSSPARDLLRTILHLLFPDLDQLRMTVLCSLPDQDRLPMTALCSLRDLDRLRTTALALDASQLTQLYSDFLFREQWANEFFVGPRVFVALLPIN